MQTPAAIHVKFESKLPSEALSAQNNINLGIARTCQTMKKYVIGVR